MKEKLILVKIDSAYCDYLREYDEKVPYNYKEKELRPFIGVLFTINNCKYFAPLSSPKPKFLKMKNKIDFLKIDSGKLGAINFNNMIPVMDNNIEVLDLNKKVYDIQEEKYIRLLKKQIFWLNRNNEKLYTRSKKLYNSYINDELEINIKLRCCNFKLLEEKCNEYNSVLI